MGVPGRVNSPTFCIVQEHRRLPSSVSGPSLLVHMDLYRLHGEDDVIAIGWEDYLAEGAILVVEWPERAGALVPSAARHIIFTHLDGEGLVAKMESGEMNLDEMIKAFEEGRKLVADCQKDLDSIRQRIEKVTKDGSVEPLNI